MGPVAMNLVLPIDIARAEEARQGWGVAQVASDIAEWGGGVLSFGGVGSWANFACGQALYGPIDAATLDERAAIG